MTEATSMFWNYINKNNLNCEEEKTMIILNERLITTLITQKDNKNIGGRIEKKEIIERYKNRLRPFHFITLSGINN